MISRVFNPRFEAFSVFFLIMTVLWFVPKQYQFVCFTLLFIAIIWSFVGRKDSMRDLGFEAVNFKHTLLLFLCVAAIVCIFAVLGWYMTGSLKLTFAKFQQRTVAYYFWALFQQFILNSYFVNRFMKATHNKNAASLYAGILFGIIHLPNPFLLVITLILGPLSARLFLENRNLYILALAHAIVGTSLGFLGGAPGFNMRVGPGYFAK
ncbi:MAG: CPBP family glutamic-type intramembrane protease [Patescibacteria group bacterium]